MFGDGFIVSNIRQAGKPFSFVLMKKHNQYFVFGRTYLYFRE